MRGIIEQARPSKSGKSLGVLIQGTWYTTRHFVLQSKIGSEVVFDPKPITMGDGGIVQTIQDYTLVGEQAPAPVSSPGGPRPAQASPPPNPYQPLVSNLAAHLIAAGQQPSELKRWFEACLNMLEPDSDDDIPY